MEVYDSTKATNEHKARVASLIDKCIAVLEKKKTHHDLDKINNKVEKKLFDEYTPKLKDSTYGSKEYNQFLKELKPALDIHYNENRHHPEHFVNGIDDMNLLDLIEMICDWKASSERHGNGNIFKSIEINQERFWYSDQLKNILKNTADFLIDTSNSNDRYV